MQLTELRRVAKAWIENRGMYSEPWEVLERLIVEEPQVAFRLIEEIHHILCNEDPPDYEVMGMLAAT